LGRWLSMDALSDEYISFSPYNFSINNPILFNDPDGMKIINMASNPENRIVIDQTIKKIQEKNIALYNIMQFGKVFQGKLIMPGNVNYDNENAQEIIITIDIDDIDNDKKDDEQSRFGNEELNSKIEYADDKRHLNGTTSPFYSHDKRVKISQENEPNGEFKLGVDVGIESPLFNYEPIIFDLSNKSVMSDIEKIKLLEKYGKIECTEFHIMLDDFQNTGWRTRGKSQEDLYFSTLSHEFGHVKGILYNAIKSFFYSFGKNDQKGHMDGNPSGDEANFQSVD
jgi:hypothetical protein